MELKLIPSTDGATRVKVIGEINPGPEAQLKQPLVEALGADAFKQRVTLDLADCDYVSSSGIGWLLSSNTKFKEAGGKLELTNLTRGVDEVIRLMSLQKVLTIV